MLHANMLNALGIREFIYHLVTSKSCVVCKVLHLLTSFKAIQISRQTLRSQASEIAKNSLGSYSIELHPLLHNQAVSALVSINFNYRYPLKKFR